MLQTEHIPKLIAGCESSKSLEAHPETAKCIMDAADFAAMKECKELNGVMKMWMKGA